MRLRAFEVNVKGCEWSQTVHALTAGKAKYIYLMDVRESWQNVSFKDLTIRSLGKPRNTRAFAETAARRGLPFARIGMRVECDGKSGQIIDRNDSANFRVLFDDGHIGDCHPRWRMRYFDDDGKLLFDSEALA